MFPINLLKLYSLSYSFSPFPSLSDSPSSPPPPTPCSSPCSSPPPTPCSSPLPSSSPPPSCHSSSIAILQVTVLLLTGAWLNGGGTVINLTGGTVIITLSDGQWTEDRTGD